MGDGGHRGVGDRKMHSSFYPDHDQLNPQLQYLGTGAQLQIILSTVGFLWILSVKKTHIFPIQRQDFNALRKLTIDHQAVIRLRESGRRICLEGTQTLKESELRALQDLSILVSGLCSSPAVSRVLDTHDHVPSPDPGRERPRGSCVCVCVCVCTDVGVC